ncbi:glycoside hydrolase family 3 N-terminal domain-containing protein [Novosphingobium album (ex Hu et al. 2023)]|uniref:beta-glucosidase n=1 Tax=Novosphingobium album (ex Hu et al. 2023) TaxID=2930093 RepID=A0ABT0B5D1_9SPHN|nr:glycoside hydrolase family 3 N-terminal domain-containing protein [Novosphingobium album (ex Hu et al. 2023)]MCJ2180242.1 glycoside hydrolase family 3 C-terminal domain-containing protein [Novosphingobium album (ex Hu et al. 2023)]
MAVGLAGAWMASPLRAAMRSHDSAAAPAFIDALIARMTLEEKAGQLTLNPAAMRVDAAAAANPKEAQQKFEVQLAEAVAGKLTGVFNGSGAVMAKRMQTAVMRDSRLKIPLIFAADVIHGYRTVFPVPVGEAASFEPSLAERTARATAVEAAAAGLDWTFAPMVDIARDQRWGRVMEGAGEDVRLGCLFAAARVRGFQGDDLTADNAMLACAKHFAAYGAPEGGLDYNGADISERTLREIYLPPFRAAFDAGALTAMSSFNAIGGVPASANKWLLTDLLRGEWHFPGIVVSDYKSDEELIVHGVAKDGKDAARLAFLAGVDMSMASNLYALHLPDLVREGAVPADLLDASVRRVLMLKARIGLFDDPFRRIDPAREKARSRLPGAMALAREAGCKSIVMLKNDGGTLPLKKSARVALIGPFASGAHDLIGGWAVFASDGEAVDLATGMRAAGGNITVVEGCGVNEVRPGQLEEALDVARDAEVVVLSLGENQSMSGEAASRTEIVLPAAQQELAQAVAALGKPTVVVLRNGRALALEGAVLDVQAILVSWFLGTQSGHSIADVLYGSHGPAGRLPMSFPFRSGQEPYHYDHASTGRPQPEGPIRKHRTNYLDTPHAALFPFGHGLTFGAPVYSDFAMDGPVLSWHGMLQVSAKITNTGGRACEEVVQCYVHDNVARVTPPVRKLIGFQKVALGPGESRTVRFDLQRNQLEYVGPDNTIAIEPGEFRVWIAPSAQDDGASGTFTLTTPG